MCYMNTKSPARETPQEIRLAVDNAIFTVMEGALHVLLIQMTKKPFTRQWALPGGLVRVDETLDAAAARILEEQTGVKDVYLEQLYTFGRLDRDPLDRVVSVAYVSLIAPPVSPTQGLRTTTKYSAVRWWRVSEASRLAYDHDEILSYARKRLAWKLEYTNVSWSLLPRKFRLTDLQRVYEAVLGHPLDKRNFRKKILSLGLIESVGEVEGGAHRPAMLYRFRSRRPRIVEIL